MTAIDLYTASEAPPTYAGKRLLDVTVSVAALVMTAPLILLLAILISLDGHAPFFGQRRIGRGGRPFTIWKLRSMVPDAEAAMETYLAENPAARAEWDANQKLSHDPRVTRIGRFLRKTSLDELPQFWNVLKGDMSVVGPRPILPEQARLYPGDDYYRLRPGITGPWQVSARNTVAFADRAHHDAGYLADLRMSRDIMLILRTAAVVLDGTGR